MHWTKIEKKFKFNYSLLSWDWDYPVLEEAKASLSNREVELANESEKDKVVAEATSVCDITWETADGLDSAGRATAETTQLYGHLDQFAELQTRIAETKLRTNPEVYDAE